MQTKGCKIVSTKIKKLNEITSIGGLPKGEIIEICGDESSGKHHWL